MDQADRRSSAAGVGELLTYESVLERSQTLDAASAEVRRNFDVGRWSAEPRESGPSWEPWRRAVVRRHAAMESMYPEPLWRDMKVRLRSADATAREIALVFLEADPWCFRSGYEKAELMKHSAHLELDSSDQERVRRIVVHVLQQPPRREFRRLVGLAASIWSPKLDTDLQRLERLGGQQVREQVARLRSLMANRLHEASLRADAGARWSSIEPVAG